MKYYALLLSFLMAILCSTSTFQTSAVTVKIQGIKNNKGAIIIGLYNSETDFPIYEKNFRGATLNAIENKNQYTFKNIPAGKYAVALWHDENENKILDKNLFGAPKESYGFSNNKYGKFGPPDFEDVSFEILKNETIELTITVK